MHTFGVGDDVHRELVIHIAEASEGVWSFYTTGGNLNATVINVLMKASAASIYNLRFNVSNAIF